MGSPGTGLDVLNDGTPVVLDGPMGTALEARGIPTPPPLWSAAALDTAPGAVRDLHGAYAAAGARVHTACTFRTTRRAAGPRWRALVDRAVALARAALPEDALLAGSIAPLEDCWHPERSPSDPGPEHALLARALSEAGCELLLCETFAHVGEGVAAVRAAVATGRPTWASFTPGYRGDLLTPDELAAAGAAAVEAGACAVLVNCLPAVLGERYLAALVGADLGVPIGIYANAGSRTDGLGWGAVGAPARYAALAQRWVDQGATIVGGCCGTDAATTAAVVQALTAPGAS